MSQRRIAMVCIAACAALAIPAGFTGAAPSGGATKVSAKSASAAKSPSFKVSGKAKSSVPPAKAAKAVKKRGP